MLIITSLCAQSIDRALKSIQIIGFGEKMHYQSIEFFL